MCALPSVAEAASLIADPARAAMLIALTDGRAMPAGELYGYAAAIVMTQVLRQCRGDLPSD